MSSQLLNKDLVSCIEATKALEARTTSQPDFTTAITSGLVAEVRKEMMTCYRLGVRLESYVDTFAPPLAAGGTAGVSAEVQEAIASHIRALTTGCADGLSRMLAFEKEHAIMRTKCTDDDVWKRYCSVLQDNQLHDLTKALLQTHSDLLMVGNTICNNLQHLRSDCADTEMNSYY